MRSDRRNGQVDRHGHGGSVNPILDIQNQTAVDAVRFICSALGSRVWDG
ncbi:MAG: hypothetical protein MZU91_02090 [Desulfosudis oleivorans]|nr:hypothetical protein [Desulfosudis oleivorans]